MQDAVGWMRRCRDTSFLSAFAQSIVATTARSGPRRRTCLNDTPPLTLKLLVSACFTLVVYASVPNTASIAPSRCKAQTRALFLCFSSASIRRAFRWCLLTSLQFIFAILDNGGSSILGKPGSGSVAMPSRQCHMVVCPTVASIHASSSRNAYTKGTRFDAKRGRSNLNGSMAANEYTSWGLQTPPAQASLHASSVSTARKPQD